MITVILDKNQIPTQLRIAILTFFESAKISFGQIESQNNNMFVDLVFPINCFVYSIHYTFDKLLSHFITCEKRVVLKKDHQFTIHSYHI